MNTKEIFNNLLSELLEVKFTNEDLDDCDPFTKDQIDEPICYFFSDYYLIETNDTDLYCDNGSGFQIGNFNFNQCNKFDSELLNITLSADEQPKIKDVISKGNDVYFLNFDGTKISDLSTIKNIVKISDILASKVK